MKKTIIKEEFKINDFIVVPVMIWNKYQNSYFNRYLVFYKDRTIGYMSDYMKLNRSNFMETFNQDIKRGYITLKNSSNLSMLKYN